MSYIFISYSHDNETYAADLASHLMMLGFDVWFDDRNDETTNIVEVVQNSAAVLFVMSSKGGESRWVQRELAAAVQKSKPYYPLLLEGRPWTLLRGSPYTDVKDGKLPGKELTEKLANHLSKKPSRGVNRAPQQGAFSAEDNPSVTTMARPSGFRELAILLKGSQDKKPD